MNRKTSAGSGALTPKQLKFVAAWQGDVVAAVRALDTVNPKVWPTSSWTIPPWPMKSGGNKES